MVQLKKQAEKKYDVCFIFNVLFNAQTVAVAKRQFNKSKRMKMFNITEQATTTAKDERLLEEWKIKSNVEIIIIIELLMKPLFMRLM